MSLRLILIAFTGSMVCKAAFALPVKEDSKPLRIALTALSDRMDLSTLADAKRDVAIRGIQDLLVSGPAEKRPVLLFRLAELQFEKSRSAFNKEYQKFDLAFQAFVDGGRKGAEPDLKNFTSASEREKENALLSYNELLTKYPDYPRLDEVYYSLGAAYFDSAQKKQAAERFSDLIREFPKSQYLQDAYLGLGEFYFDAREIPKATVAYKKAYDLGVQAQKTSSYVYALYKSAWCDFNEQRFSESLLKLKQVIAMSNEAALRQEKQGGFKDAVQLGLEALNDTVRAFARLGDVDGAIAYWNQEAPQKSTELTEKMGTALLGNGNYRETAKTFESLLAKYPSDEKSTLWRSQKMLALKELDDRVALISEANKASDYCIAKSVTTEVCAPIENRLREFATHFHQHANKRKNQDDLKDAASLYRIYVKTFSSSTEITRMRFYLAEIEWELENFRDAAFAYKAVREKDSSGEFFEKSLVAELLAWDKLVAKGSSKEISEAEKEWIAVASEMAALSEQRRLGAENESKLPEITYKAATLYLSHDLFEEAQSHLNLIVKRWPKTTVASKSVEILFDRLETSKDNAGLIKLAQTLKTNVQLMSDAKLLTRVELYEQTAYFNQAMEMYSKADSGQWNDVAHAFSEFANRYTKNEKRHIAHYNSALAFQRAYQFRQAIAQAKMASESSTDQKIRHDASLLLADLYEKTFDFKNAAYTYLEFAKQNNKDEKAADALIKATTLSAITEDAHSSIAAYEKLSKDFPQKANDEDLVIQNARLLERVGKNMDAVKRLQNHKLKSSLRVQVALAKMQNRFGKVKERTQACETVKSLSKEGEGPAFCDFHLLLEKENAYKKLSLKTDLSHLKTRIEQKRALMEDLARQFLEIPSYKNAEWGLAAMIEAADVLQVFAQALREIPMPKDLNEEGIEVFRAQIEEIVFPVQERALSLTEEATTKAFELGVYSKYLTKGVEMLRHKEKLSGAAEKAEFYSFGKAMAETVDRQKCKAEKEELLERIATQSPNVDVKLRLADVLTNEGAFEQAEWILDGLVEEGVQDSNLWNLKGLIKLKTDSATSALSYFEKASQSNAPGIDAMLNIAALSDQFKDEARAKKVRETIASKKEAT